MLLGLTALLPVVFLAGISLFVWAGVMCGALLGIGIVRYGPNEDAGRFDVEPLINHVRHSRKLVILDPQTALLQRWYFDLRLLEESERCRRHGFMMAVLFVRLDIRHQESNFHEIPDTRAAQVFVGTIRKGDLAAKIDARTYSLCLTHADEAQAGAAVRRLLSRLDGTEKPEISLAMCPADGSDVASLYKAAKPFDWYSTDMLESHSRTAVQQVGPLLASELEGEIALKPEETIAQAKARARRAAKRAGVNVRLWEADGVLRFERRDVVKPEARAA